MLGFTLKRGKDVQSFKLALGDLFARVAPESGDNELLDVAEQGRVLVNDYVDVDGDLNIESFVKFLLGEWPNQRVRNTVKTFVLEIMTTDLIDGEVITDSNNRDANGPVEGDELIDAIISMYEVRLSRTELAREMQKLRKEYEVEDPDRLKEELIRLLPADAEAFINFVATSFVEDTEYRTRELRYWSHQIPDTSSAPKAPAAERNKVKMLITKIADKLMKKIRATKNIASRESIRSIEAEVLETVRSDVPVKPILATAVAAAELFDKIADTLSKGNPDFERVDVIHLLVRICGSRLFESERVREERLARGVEELCRILQENTAYRRVHDYIWRTANHVPTTQTESYFVIDTMLNFVRALRASKPQPAEIEDLIEDCRRIKNAGFQRLFKGMVTQWVKLTRNFVISWGVNANVLSAEEPPGYVPPKTVFYKFDDGDSAEESNMSKPSSLEPSPLPTPKVQAAPGLKINSSFAPVKVSQASPASSIQARTPVADNLAPVQSKPVEQPAVKPLAKPAATPQPTSVAVPGMNPSAAYLKSWEACGRPLSFFEIHNLKRFILRTGSEEKDLAQALAGVASYQGFVADVLTLVSPGLRTVKHQDARVEAENRLRTHSSSPFCVKTPATLPLRPSGIRMERGSLVEVYHVLLSTFARHFYGAQLIDARVAGDVIEYFGLSVLQELWSLRFSFIAAATAWRKTSSTVSEADMRQVSQTFISFMGRPKHVVACGSVDLFFSSVETQMDLPGILLDCFEVTSEKTIFVSDVCGLLKRCADATEEIEGVARILASDHGLLVKDEDSFQAFLEIVVLNCDPSCAFFDRYRQALLDGLLNQ